MVISIASLINGQDLLSSIISFSIIILIVVNMYLIQQKEIMDFNFKNILINLAMNFKEDFKKVIEEKKIVLFMKGTKDAPVCGFSKTVVSVLNHYGVDFHDVNILGHEDMRPALSELSGWPTFPQLFVNGKLLGGCDITVDMHENGQLLDALDV